MSNALFTNLIRLADDHLILGHRLSEWCGHAPMLEEDLAMPNIALDLLGQARSLYTYAGKVEGKNRDEDALAFMRIERDYKNLLMCERRNGDFAHTMLRQLFFALFMQAYWEEAGTSSDNVISGIAGKAVKEATYHVRHTGEWVVRLGDGTDESAKRLAEAMGDLRPYVGELFETDALTAELSELNILPNPAALKEKWHQALQPILSEAMVEIPDFAFEGAGGQTGGRSGQHTEDMGYLLAELQYMQRTFPGMKW